MKSQKLILVVSFLALAIAAFSLFRPEHKKIGVVDNQALIGRFSEAIEARNTYNKMSAEWDAKLKQLEDSIKVTVQYMTDNYEKSSPSEKQRLRDQLERWNREYQKYAASVKEMKDKKLADLLQPVGEKIDDFLRVWAERNGYGILIGTGYQGGVILSLDGSYNVTYQVLEDLNREYPIMSESKDSTKKPVEK